MIVSNEISDEHNLISDNQPSSEMEKISNWVEIDLGMIRRNVERILRKTRTPLMAVVKANCYGHGVERVVPTLVKAGVSWLGVARCNEAIHLRRSGWELPILVFEPTQYVNEISTAVDLGITLTLPSLEYVIPYAQVANKMKAELKVHLKVDTGMGRMGIFPEEVTDLCRAACKAGGLKLTGIYSQFAIVDEVVSHPLTSLQLERFSTCLRDLERNGFTFETIHFSNSGSLETLPASFFNLTRCGSTIYGLTPTFFQPYPDDIQPALTWKARLVSSKKFPPGWGIGYGQEYVTTGDEYIGVVAVGYADGYRRAQNNRMLLDGKVVPVVGRVNMDNCIVALPGPMDCGSEAVIIGLQGSQRLTAQDHGDTWGTIDADVTSQINTRVPRLYINDG